MNQGESVSRRGRVHSSLFPDFISVCECLIINSCSWRRRLLLHGHVCRGKSQVTPRIHRRGTKKEKNAILRRVNFFVSTIKIPHSFRTLYRLLISITSVQRNVYYLSRLLQLVESKEIGVFYRKSHESIAIESMINLNSVIAEITRRCD